MNFTGIVAGGSAKAHALGYPTANISLTDTSVSGIFAATVRMDGIDYTAVAFADPVRSVLEAHLFGFSGNLYGKEIVISLVKKIRDTKQFADNESLMAAMKEDAEEAKRILS